MQANGMTVIVEADIVQRIIKEQELVIGPLAWREAAKVSGLRIENHHATVDGALRQVLADLVARYEGLFGPASVEVCREAVRNLVSQVPSDDIPEVLK